jgi:5,10-methylenetetrahydromethanopterin reductase
MTDLDAVLWTPSAIEDDGWAACDLVRAHFARVVIRPLPAAVDPPQLAAIGLIRRSYDYCRHADTAANHASDVSDDYVECFALAGMPTECAERLVTIAAAGSDQVPVVPFVGPGGDRADTMRGFAQPARPEWPQRVDATARHVGGRAGSQPVPVRVVAVNGSSKTSMERTGT